MVIDIWRIMNFRPPSYGYMAGFLDGEGSISIVRARVEERRTGRIRLLTKSRNSRSQRVGHDPKTGRINKNFGNPYTKREMEIYEKIRDLNKKGVEGTKAW